MAMLTEAAGVTAPTLYAAFGSKEDLYREVLTAYRGDMSAIPLRDGSLFRTLEVFLRRQAARFADPAGPRGCMVSTGVLRAGGDNRSAVDATAAHRQEDFALFVRLIEQAKEKGEITPTTDADALARFYMAVVQGMSVQAIDGASAERLNALVEVALAAWPRPTAGP